MDDIQPSEPATTKLTGSGLYPARRQMAGRCVHIICLPQGMQAMPPQFISRRWNHMAHLNIIHYITLTLNNNRTLILNMIHNQLQCSRRHSHRTSCSPASAVCMLRTGTSSSATDGRHPLRPGLENTTSWSHDKAEAVDPWSIDIGGDPPRRQACLTRHQLPSSPRRSH